MKGSDPQVENCWSKHLGCKIASPMVGLPCLVNNFLRNPHQTHPAWALLISCALLSPAGWTAKLRHHKWWGGVVNYLHRDWAGVYICIVYIKLWILLVNEHLQGEYLNKRREELTGTHPPCLSVLGEHPKISIELEAEKRLFDTRGDRVKILNQGFRLFFSIKQPFK